MYPGDVAFGGSSTQADFTVIACSGILAVSGVASPTVAKGATTLGSYSFAATTVSKTNRLYAAR